MTSKENYSTIQMKSHTFMVRRPTFKNAIIRRSAWWQCHCFCICGSCFNMVRKKNYLFEHISNFLVISKTPQMLTIKYSYFYIKSIDFSKKLSYFKLLHCYNKKYNFQLQNFRMQMRFISINLELK